VSDDEFKTCFEPTMLGQIVEVTVIHSRHTGSNYYNSEVKDVSTIRYGGRLAEYGDRSFTFEPVGTAMPTVTSWPYSRQDGWPNNAFRLEIRVSEPTPAGTPDLPTTERQS